MSLKDKMAQSGFTPTQRALDADAFIASRNPQDNPDEFSFLGSMGYVYTGPASFYTSGSEYTAWLNSQLVNKPFKDATDVARAIDANPKIPKAKTGIFAPIGDSKSTTTSAGMLTGPTTEQVNALYQKYLGRSAEKAGLDYWLGTGQSIEEIEANIKLSTEAQKFAASQQQTNQQTRASIADINALYRKYLGRDARQSGLDYWRSTGEYADRGIQSLADIEYNISISDEAHRYLQAQQQQQTNAGTTTVSSGATFTPSTPQGLTYTPVSLPSVAPAPSVQNVDYVKMLRGALTNSLFKDLV